MNEESSSGHPGGLKPSWENSNVTWSIVHSRSTFDVSTNSQPTVIIDQNDRIRTYCNDLTRVIPGGAVLEHQIHSWWSDSSHTRRAAKKQKDNAIDTCVIRTHAPEGTALAGQRVNHSAKVPDDIMLLIRGAENTKICSYNNFSEPESYHDESNRPLCYDTMLINVFLYRVAAIALVLEIRAIPKLNRIRRSLSPRFVRTNVLPRPNSCTDSQRQVRSLFNFCS